MFCNTVDVVKFNVVVVDYIIYYSKADKTFVEPLDKHCYLYIEG
jgi:hypothetical protein